MILDSMRAIQADGAAFIDAHPDLEVFRLRLGKALNFDVRLFEPLFLSLSTRFVPLNSLFSCDPVPRRLARSLVFSG